MTQTSNRLLDEIGKLMTDAAGAAQGLRGEVESLMRAQAERILSELDVVQREEFEAVREMAVRAREENARLERRIDALESKRATRPRKTPAPGKTRARAAKTRAR